MQAVETARLRLRMITTEDAEFIQRLYNSEDFLRYIGDKEITNTVKAEEYIENNILKMHQEKGVCLLMVKVKATSTPIGVCGLITRTSLLKQQDWSVSMIANRLVDKDPYNLSHRFKKHFGLSPSQYRKNYRLAS